VPVISIERLTLAWAWAFDVVANMANRDAEMISFVMLCSPITGIRDWLNLVFGFASTFFLFLKLTSKSKRKPVMVFAGEERH
jgi:hypothetical protein